MKHTNQPCIKLMNKTLKHTVILLNELDLMTAYQIVAGKRGTVIYGHSFKGRASQIAFDTSVDSMIKNDFPRLSEKESNDMFFEVCNLATELRAFRENLRLKRGNDKQDS